MRRCFAALAAASALLFAACSNQPTLYDRGVALAEQLQALARSEEYLGASIGNYMMETAGGMMGDISALDMSAPEAVYAIAGLGEAMAAMQFGDAQPSDDIMAMLAEKLPASLPVQMSGLYGVETLAAASVLNAGDSFLFKGLEAPVTYVYLYGGDYGVMVSFLPHEGGVVSASAGVFAHEPVAGAESAEELAAALEEYPGVTGLEIEQVKN